MERLAFAAMGTRIEALLDAPASPTARAALAWVRAEFERLEDVFSRFRPDSELSRLNAAGAMEASDDMRAVVELALAARERTAGRFDPTLHDALVNAGYDRSFELLPGTTGLAPSPAPAGVGERPTDDRDGVSSAAPEPREVAVRGRRIELGDGVALDFGGIVKGFAADRCAAQLGRLAPCLVNAGGDLAVAGTPATGPWPVAVEIPRGQLTLAVGSGGLATTGRDRRRWVHAGRAAHHLIDPRTGRPAEDTPLTVTVAAPSATEAEVAAKAIFLAGPHAEEEAERLATPAVIVAPDGDVRLVGRLA